MLNSYLTITPPRKIIILLVAFFIFELLWGNSLSVTFVVGGYSTFSFIAIYILAGLLRKMQIKIKLSKGLLLFLFCVVVNTILYIIIKRLNLVAITPMVTNYINPLVIACAALLLLMFVNMEGPKGDLTCRFINWLGASCFGVYLIHGSTPLWMDTVKKITQHYSGIVVVAMLVLFILAVFACAIILDQPRKFIWKKLILPNFDKNVNDRGKAH